MTSDISFILKFIPKHDQQLSETSTPNGILSNRLLSPITENSAELLSTTLPLNRSSSDTSQTSSSDDLTRTLLQRFSQYTTNFNNIQNYLDLLDQRLKGLSIIINCLENDENLMNIIEPIETRLLQMRVKRDQIDYLLNQSSIKNIIQQISPLVQKYQLDIDDNEFLNSIQLSMNQTTTLIDHLKSEYRYIKYEINDYSTKLHQRHELLIQLLKQIEQFLSQHDRIIKQVNYTSIINEHNRQCIELNQLSNEYEQLRNENYLLTLKAKENLKRFSTLMQSNHHHHH